MAKRALIAVGGNSLIRPGERGTIEEQLANARSTAATIVELAADGWNLVITHGNGPQVGAALLRSERAAGEVYTHPLDVCVATTQSEIGYLLEQALESELRRKGLQTPVMTVLTQVRVREDDPAFNHPTKPIGPFYSRENAEQTRLQYGWEMREDTARGYRRVVPSPEPIEVVEQQMIRQMLELGIIVIALGGGGIPVFLKNNSEIVGVEAVIDKDRASALLAAALGIEYFLISTEVESVCLHYKKPGERIIQRATAAEMEQYLTQGHFPAGSMGPKIESAIRFLRGGGKEVIVTSPEKLLTAIRQGEGTHIFP